MNRNQEQYLKRGELTMNGNQEQYVILDWDSMKQTFEEQGLEVPAMQFGEMILDKISVLSEHIYGIALVPHYDPDALTAFAHLRLRALTVTNDREDAVQELEELIDDQLDNSPDPPAGMTVITSDDHMVPSIKHWAKRMEVRLMGLESTISPALRHPKWKFHPLDRMLHTMRAKRSVIVIDAENIIYRLLEKGRVIDVRTIVQGLQEHAVRYGKVVKIIAAADFTRMRESLGRDLMDEFAEVGVETLHDRGMRGKSSSDFRLVEACHGMLNAPDPPDTYILATGDSDFRKLVQTIQQRGKKAVIFGMRGATSKMLIEDADEHDWLDDFLTLTNRKGQQPGQQTSSPNKLDSLVELVVHFEGQQRKYQLPWLSSGRLLAALTPNQVDTDARRDAHAQLRLAISERVLLSEQRPNPHPDPTKPTVEALTLNASHPTVRSARLMIARVQHHVHTALVVQRRDFAGFSLIASTLERDPQIRQVGLARTRQAQMRWLNLLIDADLLRKERLGSPHNCDALLLPTKRPASATTVEAKQDDEATMLRRLITAADTWMAQRNLDWAPLRGLHQRLGRFGNDTFRAVIEQVTRDSEALQQYHKNAHGPHPVCGLHLNSDGPNVVVIRQERESILAALRSIESDQVASAERLQMALDEGISPDHHARWTQVLLDEGILLQQSDGFRLNQSHVLVSRRVVPETQAGSVVPNVIVESKEVQTITEAMNDKQRKYLQAILEAKQKRLHALELNAAIKGIDTSAEVQVEIGQLRDEVSGIDVQLATSATPPPIQMHQTASPNRA